MKRNFVRPTGQMDGVLVQEGIRLSTKLARARHSNEPIDASASIVSTERKDGVLPQYDIRTDRFEQMLETYDQISKSHLGNRQKFIDGWKPDDDPNTTHTGSDDVLGSGE